MQAQSEKEMSDCACSCKGRVSTDEEFGLGLDLGLGGGEILHSNVSSHHFNLLSVVLQGSGKCFGEGREQLYYPPPTATSKGTRGKVKSWR